MNGKLNQKTNNNEIGFTLIELIIIIVLIGILAAIGIQQFVSVQRGAAISAHESNIRILKSVGMTAISKWDFPNEEITWTKNDKNNQISGWGEGWEGLLEEWPKVPSFLPNQELEEGYHLLIKPEGTVMVELH